VHAWHELLDDVAAAILVVGGAIYLVRAGRAFRDLHRPRLPPGARSSAARPAETDAPEAVAGAGTVVVAALSLGAAVIHLAAAPPHLAELGALGAGFLVATAFQAGWAGAWLRRPSRALAWLGIAGSLAISAAWAWTRTIGLPVGPDAFTPEQIGAPDAATTTFQLLIAGLLVLRGSGLGRRLAREVRGARSLATIAVVPAIGVVFLATTLAVTVLAADDHDHRAGDNADATTVHDH